MKEYYNMKLYGYHQDDEYRYKYEEFIVLHEKIQSIQPLISKIIEQLEDDPEKFPRNFMKLSTGAKVLPCRVPNEELITNLFFNMTAEEVEKFIHNTVMYENHSSNPEIDENYVMCFRRAIPSEEPLYDNFWTTPESNEAFIGLSTEQPKDSPIRLHSVIKVTSLAQLKKHGIVDSERLGSEGEIAIDPNKKFEGVLFQYKDSRELYALRDYIDNGGITRQEMLETAQKTYYERTKLQGLPIFEEGSLKEQLDTICDDTTFSGFTQMSNNVRGISKQLELGDDVIEEGDIDYGANDWI